MERSLMHLPVDQDDPQTVQHLTDGLRAALDGTGPPIAPTGPAAAHPATAIQVPPEVALVVRTSGSTGQPRDVLLDRSAVVASATATTDRLGGPGTWLLALPPTHVAGLQVVVRSLLAGTHPVVVGGPFEPGRLAAAALAARRDAGRLYTALVPTQLHRILGAGTGQGLPAQLAPLRDLDAILVGGAAVPPGLLDRASAAGLRVVTSYGMTETAGGCVYDGVPLDGVGLRLADGVVHVAGAVLARGYLDGSDEAFTSDATGTRWFRTSDHGVLEDGRLHVLGRVDDVIVTGGVNVAPAAVEEVLAAQPGIGQVCVVGVPDQEWGRAVVAVVVPTDPAGAAGPGTPATDHDRLRSAVARTLGRAAAPRHTLVVDALPTRGPGKVDRDAVARLAERLVATRTEHDGDNR